jgi:hypothetical protein
MMKAMTRSRVDLKEFLEIVLMWHCNGDIPMDRASTSAFIEDLHFGEFLMSVQHWATRFGVKQPTRTEIVQTLHKLY